MVFKATNWEYSGEVKEERIEPAAGEQTLFIKSADYDQDAKVYFIDVQSLQNDAVFTLKYWLITNAANGDIRPNSAARGTLISLGIALAGAPIGIPAPQDIIGAVVQANVSLKPSKTSDRMFPRVYEFTTAPTNLIEAFSEIDQFKIGDPIPEELPGNAEAAPDTEEPTADPDSDDGSQAQ